ncbi:MAG: hypothetical protein AAFN12_14595, partial [Cyanobacteria bacterium J06560_2]
MRKTKFIVGLCIGLCFSLLWSCSTVSSSFKTFDQADAYLRDRILPNITVSSKVISDTDAYNAVIPPLQDYVPDPETYPLYGAEPTNDSGTVYVEVYS